MRKVSLFRKPVIEGTQEIRVWTNSDEVRADLDSVINKVKDLQKAIDELKISLKDLGEVDFNIGINVE